MKLRALLKRSIFVIISSLIVTACSQGTDCSVRKIKFDQDWKFHLGQMEDAAKESYDDSKWRVLNLPHDWSVEPLSGSDGLSVGPFSKESAGGFATGQTVGGEGWYRKSFTIDRKDAHKLHSLYFEGVYAQSEVWVNGQKVNFNAYGYSSFKCDITSYCHPAGEVNTIAVKVTNEGKNSRWYAGSGIYRHVWFIKTDSVHLDEWAVAVRTAKMAGDEATLAIEADVLNEKAEKAGVNMMVTIISPDGEEVGMKEQTVSVDAAGKQTVAFSLPVKQAKLWSVDTPHLYEAKILIRSGHEVLDQISVPFGIRTISFSAKEGFKLNNLPLKLKGGCVHHDNGLLGAASLDRAEARKIELLKANGYNAVRCAHNPPAEAFLRACDEQGMLVIDEAFDHWQKEKNPQDYHRFFDEWNEKDISAMVLRDRNHPSVIMWSIGNEIQERSDDAGIEIAERLRNIVKKLDPSRPVTAAINDYWDNPQLKWKEDASKAMQHLDVAGYNYMWYEYENDHQKDPLRIIYGSETVAQEAAVNWNLVEKHPYIIGDFVWTALDYLGEAGIGHTLELSKGEKNPQFMGWPWYNAWCGDIDICGEKKPQSYYRDIIWKEREITMAVQPLLAVGKTEDVSYWGWKNESLSWNWKGLEGKPVKVNVYSRAPKVRLYLNNELLGEQEVSKKDYTATFMVNYQPGELKAGATYDSSESSCAILRTTGAPVQIRLIEDRKVIKADRDDLAYVTVELIDKEGRIVPDADMKVTLSVVGNGIIRGSGNACPTDMESFRSLSPKTFKGKAMAILQPDGNVGEITLNVSAEGMKGASITIRTVDRMSAKQEGKDIVTPGSIWKDMDGNPINAHGGGILYHEGTYYWYGEFKGDSTYRLDWVKTWECWRAEAGGVACYSSKNLTDWKFEGKVLPTVDDDPTSDLHPSQVIERPKVIYNEKTGKFVMWMHIESPDYEKAHAGVAVCDSPTGTFTYLGSFKPNGADSRDQTIFKDDDGKAYHICSSEWNSTLYISLLTDDYTKPSGTYVRRFIGQSREAPAVFKRNGHYYMLSSGCTGWDPNKAKWAVSDSMMGVWELKDNPCLGRDADKTFYAQSTYVLPIEGMQDQFIAMFDRWNKTDLINSRYVWLPIEFDGDRPLIRWADQWSTQTMEAVY